MTDASEIQEIVAHTISDCPPMIRDDPYSLAEEIMDALKDNGWKIVRLRPAPGAGG